MHASNALRYRTLVLTTAFIMFIFFGTGTAWASGGGDGCNPGRANNYLTYYFSGEYGSAPGTYGGIQGFIDNYSPFVYGVSGDFSTQWVMLTTTSGSQWAQVGWYEAPQNARYTLVQFNDPGHTFWTNLDSPYPINDAIKYKVTYDPGCTGGECFRFYAGGTQLTSSGYNWSPTAQQDFSEIHTRASQMPGGYNNVSESAGIEKYYPAGGSGSWSSIAGTTETEGAGSVPGPSWDQVTPANGTSGVSAYGSYDTACAQ